MKNVVYTRQALLQLEDSVQTLVEQQYFSDAEYALDYIRDIFHFFALNLPNLVSHNAPPIWTLVCKFFHKRHSKRRH